MTIEQRVRTYQMLQDWPVSLRKWAPYYFPYRGTRAWES